MAHKSENSRGLDLTLAKAGYKCQGLISLPDDFISLPISKLLSQHVDPGGWQQMATVAPALALQLSSSQKRIASYLDLEGPATALT